ncbi:hypothetical protein [Desulfocurvus sp. DL9XJH121]
MTLAAVDTIHAKGLEPQPQSKQTMAEAMKDVRKARLRRQVYADPSLAQKLVAVEASPVYNSRGELIQSLGYSS